VSSAQRAGGVAGTRVTDILESSAAPSTLEERRIAVCLPFLLEARYSARHAADHADLLEELLALPVLQLDETIERRAIDAHGQLARAKAPPPAARRLILAAIADRHELGVLHYDTDYDILRSRTDVRFGSVWLAPCGRL